LTKYVKDRVVKPETTLEELGLTSLDRIELTMALEDRARVGLSDAAVSETRTVADLRRLTEQAAEAGPLAEPEFAFPRWNRWPLLRFVRNVSQRTWILPLAHVFFRLQIEGGEHVRALEGPVLFASNHQSHFDTPVILTALPTSLRRSLAVSMGMEFFEPYFFPEHHTAYERFMRGGLYRLAALFFRGFPLPQREPGVRHALRYMGELATKGDSILIFPEGHRTVRGEIKPFQPGVAMVASKLRLPVVPVRLDGVDRVLHQSWRWPQRGDVRVAFGAPLVLEGDDYKALTRRVQDAVIALRRLPVETTAA
jgi:long-chain acyl-CoA synthetase